MKDKYHNWLLENDLEYRAIYADTMAAVAMHLRDHESGLTIAEQKQLDHILKVVESMKPGDVYCAWTTLSSTRLNKYLHPEADAWDTGDSLEDHEGVSLIEIRRYRPRSFCASEFAESAALSA